MQNLHTKKTLTPTVNRSVAASPHHNHSEIASVQSLRSWLATPTERKRTWQLLYTVNFCYEWHSAAWGRIDLVYYCT